MSRTYDLDELPVAQVSDAAANTGEIGEPTTIDNLDQLGVSAKVIRTIREGHEQDFECVYPSPSEARMAVMKSLIEAGHPDEVLLGILLDERYEVGTRKGDRISEAEAIKDIRRARGKVMPKPSASEDFPIDPNVQKGPGIHKLTFTPFVLKNEPPPPRDFIYPGIYVRKNLTLTTARGGTGKSSIVMTENVAMATKLPLLGVDPIGDLRVAYWNGEDSPEELERRLYAICKHYRITKKQLGDRLFVDTALTLPIKLAVMDDGQAKLAVPLVSELQYALKFLKIDHLSVDPLVSTHELSENDTGHMELVAKSWARMSQEGDRSIGIVHHNRKSITGAAGQIEDSRGASSLIDAARVRRAVNTMSETQAKAAGIEIDKHKFYLSADLSRSNLSPPASALTWYRLRSVDLDNATATQPSDKVGVPEPYTYTSLGDVQFALDEQSKALAAIKPGTKWRKDPQAKQWVGHTIADALSLPITGSSAEAKGNRARIKKLIDDWLVAGELEAYADEDSKRRDRTYIRVPI